MGAIGDTGRGSLPSAGGLARLLARASAPPVAVPSAYAGESRRVVAPTAVEAPADGVSGRVASVPRAVAAQRAVVAAPAPGDEAAVHALTPSGALSRPGQARPDHEQTARPVPSSGERDVVATDGPWAPVRAALEATGDGPGLDAPGGAPVADPSEGGLTDRGMVLPIAAPAARTGPDEDLAEELPITDAEVTLAPEPSAPSLVREAVPVPQPLGANPLATQARDPSPEPVAPVVIGRIEVHVDSPAAQPDPFAGCRVVAAGLTARRGGGW